MGKPKSESLTVLRSHSSHFSEIYHSEMSTHTAPCKLGYERLAMINTHDLGSVEIMKTEFLDDTAKQKCKFWRTQFPWGKSTYFLSSWDLMTTKCC